MMDDDLCKVQQNLVCSSQTVTNKPTKLKSLTEVPHKRPKSTRLTGDEKREKASERAVFANRRASLTKKWKKGRNMEFCSVVFVCSQCET
jgi:hypothetical protein